MSIDTIRRLYGHAPWIDTEAIQRELQSDDAALRTTRTLGYHPTPDA